MSTNGGQMVTRRQAHNQMGLIVVSFDDMVRAEQAARATDYWRHVNANLPIGPITVVGRTVSGSVAVRTSGVVRPRVGARRGFWAGLLLVGLPAAGISGFIGWVVAAVITALLSLTGVIGGDAATFVTYAAAVGFAIFGGLLVGLLGGLLGACIGALVGLIDSRLNGFSESQVGAMASEIGAGVAIVAVTAGVATAPLVTDELLRLGGVPRETPARTGPAGAMGPQTHSGEQPKGGTDVAAT